MDYNFHVGFEYALSNVRSPCGTTPRTIMYWDLNYGVLYGICITVVEGHSIPNNKLSLLPLKSWHLSCGHWWRQHPLESHIEIRISTLDWKHGLGWPTVACIWARRSYSIYLKEDHVFTWTDEKYAHMHQFFVALYLHLRMGLGFTRLQ